MIRLFSLPGDQGALAPAQAHAQLHGNALLHRTRCSPPLPPHCPRTDSTASQERHRRTTLPPPHPCAGAAAGSSTEQQTQQQAAKSKGKALAKLAHQDVLDSSLRGSKQTIRQWHKQKRDELKASLLQSPGLVLADSPLDAGRQKSALAVADAALKQHGNDHEPALVLKEVLRRLDMGPPGWERSDMR